MYLEKRYYVKNWDYQKPEEKHTITILKGDKPSTIDTSKISYITVEAMYWRKANAIHNWFVENCGDGDDDCEETYVPAEKLKELLNIINMILDNAKLIPGKIQNGYKIEKGPDGEMTQVAVMEDGMIMNNSAMAAELLPTASGFFFGSYDYDQWYFEGLQRTQKELTELLKVDDNGEYYYQASW
jgi:hypothetical protein